MQTCRSWTMRRFMYGVGFIALLIVGLQPDRARAASPNAKLQPHTALTTVTVGDRPCGIAVNPETNRVYVTNFGDGIVTVLDGETRTSIARVKVGEYLSDVAVNPVTNRIYVGNYSDQTVHVLDGQTNAVIATVQVDDSPYRIAVSPSTNRIYVTLQVEGLLRVIDGDTHTVMTTLGAVEGCGVAVNPVTNRVYTTDKGQVIIRAEKTYTVTATVGTKEKLRVGTTEFAVDATTNQIFVTNITAQRDALYVIDGKTNTLVATVKTGHQPRCVAVDPTIATLFVTNSDDTVSVIDTMTRALVATVPMAAKSASSAIAVNPKTHQVYVANTDTGTISVFDGSAFLTPARLANAGQQGATAGALPPPFLPFAEQFSSGTLDLARWGVMGNVTGPGGTIEIVGTDPTNRRLRLRIEKNPKLRYRVHGIYTKDAIIDFEHPQTTEINVDIDWSQIADSRDELRAGIQIVPMICKKNPKDEASNYLQVMYRGNWSNPTQAHIEVRAVIANESAAPGHYGGDFVLFDEGYGAALAANRPFVGRKLGMQHLRIHVSENAIAVWENDKLICEQSFRQLEGLASPLPWINGHLYLVQSGVEDKPARDVFFSNLSVRQLPDQPKTREH